MKAQRCHNLGVYFKLKSLHYRRMVMPDLSVHPLAEVNFQTYNGSRVATLHFENLSSKRWGSFFGSNRFAL